MQQNRIEDKPIATPFYVLRGHSSEVQCLHFSCNLVANEQVLLSGDADGFVILWSLITYRPLAIWRAHAKSMLTVFTWNKRIVTHGRDNKIYMWEILDMSRMDCHLPIARTNEDALAFESYQSPFKLCALDVNSINFCQASLNENGYSIDQTELLVAVPGLIGSEYIDVYTLPSLSRLTTRIVAQQSDKSKLGNVMSLDLKYPLLAVGYENGTAALFELNLDHVDRTSQKQDGRWTCLKQWTAHREAILSVVINTEKQEMYSSSIDSRLVRYSTTKSGLRNDPKVLDTRHAGQQSMHLRPDNKLIATAGWDTYSRIYTAKDFRQVAVLGFHKTAIHAVAFAEKTQTQSDGVVALGSKDSKISLWKVF